MTISVSGGKLKILLIQAYLTAFMKFNQARFKNHNLTMSPAPLTPARWGYIQTKGEMIISVEIMLYLKFSAI